MCIELQTPLPSHGGERCFQPGGELFNSIKGAKVPRVQQQWLLRRNSSAVLRGCLTRPLPLSRF